MIKVEDTVSVLSSESCQINLWIIKYLEPFNKWQPSLFFNSNFVCCTQLCQAKCQQIYRVGMKSICTKYLENKWIICLELSLIIIGQTFHSAGFEVSSFKLIKWLSLIAKPVDELTQGKCWVLRRGFPNWYIIVNLTLVSYQISESSKYTEKDVHRNITINIKYENRSVQ